MKKFQHRSRQVRFKDGFPVVRIAGKDRRVSRLLNDGDSNTKTRKNRGRGYLTAGLSLAPAYSSAAGNTCPEASAGCRRSCLNETGLAALWADIREARIAKTVVFYRERQWFLDTLAAELKWWEQRAHRNELDLAVRLNMFSDLARERMQLIGDFPQVQFYVYSKIARRSGLLRPNYWVTFSRSEQNEQRCQSVLESGGNVAIVFADTSGTFVGNRSGLQCLPAAWNGYPVFDGDQTDLRFEDPRGGQVIGLRLKAATNASRAAAIESGFAIPVNEM